MLFQNTHVTSSDGIVRYDKDKGGNVLCICAILDTIITRGTLRLGELERSRNGIDTLPL